MSRNSLLCGLNSDESLIAFWKLLFCPSLRKHFGSEPSLQWCEKLIATFLAGDHATFSARCDTMAREVEAASSVQPQLSLENPPWAMLSLDMRIGMVPWATPIFGRFLLLFLSTGSANWKGKPVLPIAFVTSGGPGDSKDTAIRICAPSNAVRVSAEYWLMRGFLWRREEGPHFSLAPDEQGKTFSMHAYTDESGQKKSIYFETTNSFGREKHDFDEFLHEV